jgi:cytochrome c oxidase subunit III
MAEPAVRPAASAQAAAPSPEETGAEVHAEHSDPAAGKLGMWLFLFSEALLFGTMFIVYATYLHKYTWMFRSAAHHLSRPIGAINTAILLTSSLTVALAIAAMQRGRRRQAVGLLLLTVGFAAAFLVIKSFEWAEKFRLGLYPRSETLLLLPPGEQVYFGLYYVMTGLHGLHVLAGAAVILWAVRLIRRGRIHPGRTRALENVGLYWHLVDIVWIYLFPLFYLIA